GRWAWSSRTSRVRGDGVSISSSSSCGWETSGPTCAGSRSQWRREPVGLASRALPGGKEPVIFTETRLKGGFLVDGERREDERGFFFRAFCHAAFARAGPTTV